MIRTRIVAFAKAPLAGKVKTRLIPAVGADGAAALARGMLLETWAEMLAVPGVEAELCVEPDAKQPEWLGLLPPGSDGRLSAQGSGDLGERLARVAERVTRGGERVILIGTDCPELDRVRLARACGKLERHDAVIHPALDGGYALLGLTQFDASLFEGVAWSTATVAADTIARIGALGWSLHVGDTLRDIDEPADLR